MAPAQCKVYITIFYIKNVKFGEICIILGAVDYCINFAEKTPKMQFLNVVNKMFHGIKFVTP